MMNRNDPTMREQIRSLLPVLESRHNDLRARLINLESGSRPWGVDIELAVQDMKAILEVMTPELPEDEI